MTTEYLEAGLHPDVPMEDYIADPCPEPSISKGMVKTLVERSPAHMHLKHPRLGGADDTHSTRSDLGSGSHAKLLGGAERIAWCDATYASGKRKGEVVTDWTARDAQEFQRVARADGLIPMLAHQEPVLDKMSAIARQVLEQFGAGDCEQTLTWQEGETWLRCRPDWLRGNRKLVVEYKTAKNADPADWIKTSCMGGGYDIQAALNLRGLDAILGEEEREFIFLVQEIEEPYLCSLIGAGPLMLELAHKKIEAGLRVWRRCMSEDRWPGYDTRIHWADPPSWAVFDWEAKDIAYGHGGK